jgi:aryl-alcohol dehydrogenase-like predicted oxidoreductase
MKYRKLGETGLLVSEIGFGAWGIGGGAYGNVEEEDSLAALNLAFDKGVNFYDTSNLYGAGRSEELIAEAFASRRDKVIIASKGGTLPHSGFYMPQNFSCQHLENALNESLKRLKTDYIDLYQLHSPPQELLDSADEVFELLEKFMQKGLIRAYGVSTRSPGDAIKFINRYNAPVVQVNFNLIDQRALYDGLFDLASEKNVGVINRTPLVFGFLTRKLTGKEQFDKGDHRANWPKDQLERWADAAQLFDFLQADGARTPIQAALRFCLDQPSVSVVIPGMLNKAHVIENVDSVPPLSQEELANISRIYKENDFYDKEAKARGKQK